MFLYILLVMPMIFIPIISMELPEQFEAMDEDAIAAQRFKRETVDPARLTLIPSPPIETCSETYSDDSMSLAGELPIKKERNRLTANRTYDFPLGGKIHIMHFSLKSKILKKKRKNLTDWFNRVLDSIACPEEQVPRLRIISFCIKTGKECYERAHKARPQCAAPLAVQQRTRAKKDSKKRLPKKKHLSGLILGKRQKN